MKNQRPSRTLLAEAGPRIRAPQRSERWGSLDLAGQQTPFRSARTTTEAAEFVLLQLREVPLALLPWGLDRRDPVRHLGWLIAGGVGLPSFLMALGAAPAWSAVAVVLASFGAWRLLSSRERCTAVAAREIQTELEHGSSLGELEADLERLVRDAPDLDGARLLLAQTKLDRGEPLAALVQLAPLRDRHPNEGAVVLLAALAYACLGAEEDAARMLEVLRIEDADAWSDSLVRFHELCVGSQRAGARVSSDDLDAEM